MRFAPGAIRQVSAVSSVSGVITQDVRCDRGDRADETCGCLHASPLHPSLLQRHLYSRSIDALAGEPVLLKSGRRPLRSRRELGDNRAERGDDGLFVAALGQRFEALDRSGQFRSRHWALSARRSNFFDERRFHLLVFADELLEHLLSRSQPREHDRNLLAGHEPGRANQIARQVDQADLFAHVQHAQPWGRLERDGVEDELLASERSMK